MKCVMTDRRRLSQEDIDWLDMPAVGREFGSPDFERLLALDEAAFAAFKSWTEVRAWLSTPNAELGGTCPEVAARGQAGFNQIMLLLTSPDLCAGADRSEGKRPDCARSGPLEKGQRGRKKSPLNRG